MGRPFLRSDSTYAENPRGHVWQRLEDGSIDTCAFEAEDEDRGHNGPVCVNCGYSFCEHCQAGPDNDCRGAGWDYWGRRPKRQPQSGEGE